MRNILLNLNQLNDYEFCPTRYYLERRASAGHELKTAFDVKRRMFREFFRLSKLDRKRMDRVYRLVSDYGHLLFSKTDLKNSQLMIAYMYKTFEKMLYDMGPSADSDTPGTFMFQMTENVKVRVMVDALFFSKHTVKKKNKTHTYTKTTFCYLVPHEFWSLDDLSNRFENYITAKHLWPEIKLSNDLYEVMYFCPDTGKKFIIDGPKLTKSAFSIDKTRITRACDRIVAKDFAREPLGMKCKVCPVRDKCAPHDFSQGGTAVSYVLPSLDSNGVFSCT